MCGAEKMTQPLQLAYGYHEAAAVCGIYDDYQTIVEAVRNGDLVSRDVGGRSVIAHYDLEMWLLGRPDYMDGKAARDAAEAAKRASAEVDRLEKAAQRRAIKEARAAERAQLQADLDELERLRIAAGLNTEAGDL